MIMHKLSTEESALFLNIISHCAEDDYFKLRGMCLHRVFVDVVYSLLSFKHFQHRSIVVDFQHIQNV